MICPWGKSKEAYLTAPPPKKALAPVCDFSFNIPHEYNDFIRKFKETVNVHSFFGAFKNKDAQEPFNLNQRIRQVGAYKFAIITESIIEKDW